MEKLRAFLNDDSGQDLVEYALLLTLVVLAVLTGVGAFGSGLDSVWANISTQAAGFFAS